MMIRKEDKKKAVWDPLLLSSALVWLYQSQKIILNTGKGYI